MLKLKLQSFGHLMWRTDLQEKILMLGKAEGRRRDRQMLRWLDDIIDSKGMSLSKLQEIVKEREAWLAGVHGVAKSCPWLSNWTTRLIQFINEPRDLVRILPIVPLVSFFWTIAMLLLDVLNSPQLQQLLSLGLWWPSYFWKVRVHHFGNYPQFLFEVFSWLGWGYIKIPQVLWHSQCIISWDVMSV